MCVYFEYYSNSLTVVEINSTEMVELNHFNFLIFHPISNAVFRNMITLWVIDGSLKKTDILFQKGIWKGQKFRNFVLLKGIYRHIDFVQGIGWTESFRWHIDGFPLISYGFGIQLNRSRILKFELLNFSPNFNAAFCKIIIFMGYWWIITKIYLFWIGSERG
jgi:hypothetical protein